MISAKNFCQKPENLISVKITKFIKVKVNQTKLKVNFKEIEFAKVNLKVSSSAARFVQKMSM